jgi:Transmembrane secretion effector
MRWALYSDVDNPTRQVEVFTVPSWAEQLRQADRETKADRLVADQVMAFTEAASLRSSGRW